MLLLAYPVSAQELAPRAYWPAPVGTNVLNIGYQYSSGDILTDPSLPVSGVDSQINFVQVGYQRTFNLFGRTANAQLSVPYSWGSSEGFLNDEFVSVDTYAASSPASMMPNHPGGRNDSIAEYAMS